MPVMLALAAMARRPVAKAKKKPSRTYHHGTLRAALIEATLRLVEEGGPEAVTVREAARRAGIHQGRRSATSPTGQCS